MESSGFEDVNPADSVVKLSHLNTKSSVLAPEYQSITSQYLVLQQLNAHQHMISRAKSTVDTSAPKSLQSYISVTDRLKKKKWQNLSDTSRNITMDDMQHISTTSSRLHGAHSEEEDNISLCTSLNKGVQTGIRYTDYSCKTADKISWYLEALSQGGLQTQNLSVGNNFKGLSKFSEHTYATNKSSKKVVRGDIMDWNKDFFVQSGKQFSPRILADSNAKSKVRDMRCYNPPFRKKKHSSSHSSDTFESYDHQAESSDAENSETQGSSALSSNALDSPRNRDPSSSPPAHTREHRLDTLERLRIRRRRNENENFNAHDEDIRLSFLSKVTEDILRSGLYTDQAIQQTFEFHLQFYQDDGSKEKLQSLLNQVMSSLVAGSDSDELSGRRNNLSLNLSRPDSPPEKEERELSPPDPSATELTSRFSEGLTLGASLAPGCLAGEKDSPPEPKNDS